MEKKMLAAVLEGVKDLYSSPVSTFGGDDLFK